MLAGILVTVIAVGVFFALSGGGGQMAVQSSGSDSAVNRESVNKLSVLEQYLDRYYYKSSEITREDKENGIYKGLFESLEDVYSCYYTPEEYKMLAEQTQGVYYGIGAYVSQDVETGICAISGVIKNSPAEAAGLMEGDLIYKVDGEDMSGLDIDEVVSHIRGEEGTEVALTLVRNGEEIEVKLKRGRVDTPTVESEMLDDGIGYLQITEFDDVTVNQFTENFEELKGQGMKGLIIDLRGNPGGTATRLSINAKGQILTCLWWSLSMSTAPAPRRYSQARSRIRASANWSARRLSAKALYRTSFLCRTALRSN